jgi:hypothetical protein
VDQLSYGSDARVIDVAGLTIMPGLIDTHTHLTYHGDQPGVWRLEFEERGAQHSQGGTQRGTFCKPASPPSAMAAAADTSGGDPRRSKELYRVLISWPPGPS